jgi:5-methylcytosine-specific restriction endonuclease McrA
VSRRIYARGHYRKARSSARNPRRFIALMVCIVLVGWVAFDGNHWESLTSIQVLVIGCIAALIIVSVIRWQRRKPHYRFIPYKRHAVQSRYIPVHIRFFVMERDRFRCRSCGSHRYLEIDHIIPFSLGGSHHPDNLQVLCRRCNCQKGARMEIRR